MMVKTITSTGDRIRYYAYGFTRMAFCILMSLCFFIITVSLLDGESMIGASAFFTTFLNVAFLMFYSAYTGRLIDEFKEKQHKKYEFWTALK